LWTLLCAGCAVVHRHSGMPQRLFDKTKECKFYVAGHCHKGNTCKFAHGSTDLRLVPDLTCTKICPRLLKRGSCEKAGCRYAHSADELAHAPLSTPQSAIETSGQGALGSESNASVNATCLGAPEACQTQAEGAQVILEMVETVQQHGTDAVCTEKSHESNDDSADNRSHSTFSRRTTIAVDDYDDDAGSDFDSASEVLTESSLEDMFRETRKSSDYDKDLHLYGKLSPQSESSETGVCSNCSGTYSMSTSISCKLEVCKLHSCGGCSRGSQCKFSHDQVEQHQLPDPGADMLDLGVKRSSQERLTEENSVSQRKTALPEVKETEVKVCKQPKNALYKTRTCTAYEIGVCSRGASCDFAHGVAELRPMPDWSCTKICSVLLQAGACHNATCKYAHSEKELKTRKQAVTAARCSKSKDMQFQGFFEQLLDEGMVIIKHTFLTVEDKPSQIRRVSSAPCLS